jgi:nucleoside-diphosphate-sugar epimerase
MSGTPPKREKRETVLVTGAAGTVGGYVVRELVAKGRRVIATDRPGCRFEYDVPKGSPIEIREGDITDLGFCVDVVAGADAVIHTAATIDLSLPEAEIQRINVEAVRYLYEAARARGCRRFVHFSSGSIYQKGRGALDETTPFDAGSPYEQSKVDAERYLWARPHAGGPEVTIVRPTMIYGPRARFLAAKAATIPPVLALVFSRIPRVRGGARCNWAHAEDVARAAVFLLDEPRAAWEAYNVADDTPLDAGDMLEIVTRAYGLPVGREVPFPKRLVSVVGPLLAERDLFLRAVSTASERLWKYIVEREGLVPSINAAIDKETFLYATLEAVFDTTKLRRLGWEPKWKSLREGYPEVMRWFQQHRWAPVYRADDPREWGGSVGFQFDETMAGTWRAGGAAGAGAGEPRAFRFSVTAKASNARQFARDGLFRIEGRVWAQGLADGRPLTGTIDISWRQKRELAYDFTFAGDDGRQYRFSGRKDVRILRFVETMTTLPGAIYDAAGSEVGRVLARFDLRHDLLALVGSFRTANGSNGAEAAQPAAAGAAAKA